MNFEYQTARLVLRVLDESHARSVLAFQYKDRVLFEKYEPTRPGNFYTIEYQKSLLKCEYKLATSLQSIRFYVFAKGAPDTVIGTVCLHDVKRFPYSCCELGYKFSSKYHHHGYASEAIERIIEMAFTELNLHRIYARVMPDNEDSIHLLENIGFSYEGIERDAVNIRGEWADHMRFNIVNCG